MVSIKHGYRRPRVYGSTYTRGVCAEPNCQETRLGPSGFCLKSHHSSFLRRIRKQAGPQPCVSYTGHCECVEPRPVVTGWALLVAETCQCDGCGRAIFKDGKPVRSAPE